MNSTFVPYLTLNDYLTTIQSGQLNNQLLDPISQGGSHERVFAESWSIGKVKSMLDSYFDLDMEITPTLPFVYTQKYYAGNRIVIDFDNWVAGTGSEDEDEQALYNPGDCVIFTDGTGYCCKLQNADKIFDPEKWNAIGNQYDIYFLKYPNIIFSLDFKEQRGRYTEGYYKVGDCVFFENGIYKCLVQSSQPDHQSAEQDYIIANIPHPNIFPCPGKNNQQWEFIKWFSVEKEIPFYSGVNDGIWTLGDNRDPVLVQAIVDLSVYALHRRIAPNNIPKLRDDAKNEVFHWLRDVQKGIQSIKVPSIQPTQVGDISWGGDVKKINGYG